MVVLMVASLVPDDSIDTGNLCRIFYYRNGSTHPTHDALLQISPTSYKLNYKCDDPLQIGAFLNLKSVELRAPCLAASHFPNTCVYYVLVFSLINRYNAIRSS